jgi:chorismate synthase
MIRFLTSGESHGEQLTGIVEGIPANLEIDLDFINNELKRRQKGFGRSERMSIEMDEVNILSGVYNGLTTGNPIGISIANRGRLKELSEITRPRPGHADFSGAIKYNQTNIRNVLERASARETAMRVAIGSICKLMLKKFNIEIYSHVIEIGGIKSKKTLYSGTFLDEIKNADSSPVRVIDDKAESDILKKIQKTGDAGDTLGGSIEIVASGVSIGLGNYISWDSKLDGKIAQAIMSIPGIKSVEIGLGHEFSGRYGSEVHDEIFYDDNGYYRVTNNAGGIEGGISNGEDIIIRCTMKPIPTLKKPLNSVDMVTKKVALAQVERSDVCAVPSASIVGEHMLGIVLANEMIGKFGGDSIEEMNRNFKAYINYLSSR